MKTTKNNYNNHANYAKVTFNLRKICLVLKTLDHILSVQNQTQKDQNKKLYF